MMKIFVEKEGEREVGEIAEVAWQRAQSLRNVHTLILVADRPDQVPAAKIFEQLSRQPALSPMSGIYQQRSALPSQLERDAKVTPATGLVTSSASFDVRPRDAQTW